MTDKLWCALESLYARGLIEKTKIYSSGYMHIWIPARFFDIDEPATDADREIYEEVENTFNALGVDQDDDYTDYPTKELHIVFDLTGLSF
jgi:hypothetical protein